MKFEAIIVAYNYKDFLSTTLPLNLEVLDHVVVITKENDPIIEYCQSLKSDKISIVITDAFHHDGAKFNKGLVINIGFQNLIHKEWVMTLDADIVLPPDFKDKFCKSFNNLEYIYGSRRYNIDTRKEWEDLQAGRKTVNDFILFRGFGYGFLTMWHYHSSTFQRLLKDNNGLAYPFWIKEAREIDWMFVRNWENGGMNYQPPLDQPFPDCHFIKHNDSTFGLLKEIPCYVYHLGEPGKNHEERVTEEF